MTSPAPDKTPADEPMPVLELADIPDDPNDTSPTMTCPYCISKFKQSHLLSIAAHPDLVDDITGEPLRFLPNKFSPNGIPLDGKGIESPEVACPTCRMQIPKDLVGNVNHIISIIGTPASGKSYFLTALIAQLKKLMPQLDQLFVDADPTQNAVILNYENLLFHNSDKESLVSLPKTEIDGSDFANEVTIKGVVTKLPKPFVYNMRSLTGDYSQVNNFIFYDNAGESFEPSRNSYSDKSTQHLLASDALIFLFDPFKDSRTVEQCDQRDLQAKEFHTDSNQLVILSEALTRIRRYQHTTQKAKDTRPLIIVLPKFDAWKHNFPIDIGAADYLVNSPDKGPSLNMSQITLVSYSTRQWLQQHVPEFVATCESNFEQVYFLPCSALGCSPELDKQTHSLALRVKNLTPFWDEVPFLLYLWLNGMIEGVWSGYDGVEPADDKCNFDDDKLYLSASNGKKEQIPSLYWGREVYDTRLGLISFPKPADSL